MAAFPDIQEKVEKEIMEVIGPNRKAEFKDMRNMPYTRAVILEGMGWKTTIPINQKRCASTDTKLGEYILPKGTIVIPNTWEMHHDPRNWKEPYEFKPERFLCEDGKCVVVPKYFKPFSAGGRRCPGESFAYMQMFLYLTSILQEFDIVFPDGKEPTFKGNLHLTYQIEPFLVQFIPRNIDSNI